MANITTSTDNLGLSGNANRETTIQLNRLVAKFEALLAKLDTDAGVTDANYASLLGANSSNEAKQVGNPAGTAITA